MILFATRNDHTVPATKVGLVGLRSQATCTRGGMNRTSSLATRRLR